MINNNEKYRDPGNRMEQTAEDKRRQAFSGAKPTHSETLSTPSLKQWKMSWIIRPNREEKEDIEERLRGKKGRWIGDRVTTTIQ